VSILHGRMLAVFICPMTLPKRSFFLFGPRGTGILVLAAARRAWGRLRGSCRFVDSG